MSDAWRAQFPLRARGRHIVNQRGERFRFASVNWYGASDAHHVVGGLDMRPLVEICETVASMGFTVVRLPFSNQMIQVKSVPEGAINYELNANLEGLSPLEVYDQVVFALGDAGVAVVLNNHTTIGMWSGGVEQNGMWFLEGDERYTESSWIRDWILMVGRYSHQPHVVGYDLRNEVRPVTLLSSAGKPNWGCGGPCDWARAAGGCAAALVDAGEGDGLFIVERICWPQASLSEMLEPTPPWERWGTPRDRTVLALHMYAWSGPGSWSPKAFTSGMVWSFLSAVDYLGDRSLYGELGEKDLFEQMDREWGFCLDQDICPVWLSEFGADLMNPHEMQWFESMCRYIEQKDADFAYWPLNVGAKPGADEDEPYGILTNDWKPRWADARLRAMRRIMRCSDAPSPRRHRRSNTNVSLGSFAGAGDDLSEESVELASLRRERLRTLSPVSLTRASSAVARADGTVGDHEDLPLALALSPWCHPLPGPLLPWPDEPSPSGAQLPHARYLWTALHGTDVDAGFNSAVHRGSVEELKRACISGGHGAFVLFEERGYMRGTSPEDLRTRLKSNSNRSVLFLPQEVRLCAVWRVLEAEIDSDDTQADDVPRATQAQVVDASAEQKRNESSDAGEFDEVTHLHACQRACLEQDCAGFELRFSRPGWMRLLREDDVQLPAAPCQSPTKSVGGYGQQQVPLSTGQPPSFKAGEADESIKLTDPGRRQLHVLEHALVCIGLAAHPGYDAFPGKNARVLKGASLAECRQLCLEHHFGGFAMHSGTAYFRTATDTTLMKHLSPASSSTFYVLTARELQKEDLPRGAAEHAVSQLDLDTSCCPRSRLADALVPVLWQPQDR